MNLSSPIIFFELIRVAIGNACRLSHTPTADEWGLLYAIAKKQSQVGICFAGLQRLKPSETLELPETLRLQWMGMAAKIQQRNELVNKRCIELQARLSADGIRSCILKGQGVAQQYNEDLRSLRQSGDIDVWIEGGYRNVVNWAKTQSEVTEINDHHVDLNIFSDTDVEAHFSVGGLHDKWKNRKYQKWQLKMANRQFENRCSTLGITMPTSDFNLIFLLAHSHRHLFSEGLGLRQMMDYYFALLRFHDEFYASPDNEICNIQKALRRFGIFDFASAVMWIMKEVLGLDDEYLICKPNERLGRFVLDDIMRGGNFGKFDDTYHLTEGASHLKRFGQKIVASLRYVRYFPLETFWCVVDYVCMYLLHFKTNKDLSN